MLKPEKAIAVAAGAVFRRGKILLIKRNFEPFVGCWGMPGGKVHAGEHVEEAVEREVFEETGVKARFEFFCGILSERVNLGRVPRSSTPHSTLGTDSMHYLVLVSKLTALTEKITASREGEVRWFPIRDLSDMSSEPGIPHSTLRTPHCVMIPSDYLMLERFGLLTKPHSKCRPAGDYYRCEIAKVKGRYRVLEFY
jgi:ADP-ribose pyrophosphatase YjhB (NUDIX family)